MTAKIAACWKWCGTRTGCLLEVVWYQNSSLFKVCKGVAAELAACWKRCKGAMAEPASGLSGETLKPYLAWARRQLFLERLCRHFQSWQASSAKRTNVAVRVEPQPIVVTSTTS